MAYSVTKRIDLYFICSSRKTFLLQFNVISTTANMCTVDAFEHQHVIMVTACGKTLDSSFLSY